MQYRVLFVKNRYPKKIRWDIGINWFAKNTPITLQINQIETDFDLDFTYVSNASYKGDVATGYYDKLKSVIPEGKYNAVCLIYGNSPPNVRVSYCENTPLYADTDVVQVIKDDNGYTLNHELFHAFFKKLWRRGIQLGDPMDSVIIDGKVHAYYNNDDLDATPSNRSIALQELKNYWDTIVSLIPMTATIPNEHPKIDIWIGFIKQYEGWFKPGDNPKYPHGSASFINNNPGNICWGNFAKSFGATQNGRFAKFKTYQDGYNCLHTLLMNACTGKSTIYHPTMTLLQFYNLYAPPIENDSNAYADWIAKSLGVSVSIQIKSLLV